MLIAIFNLIMNLSIIVGILLIVIIGCEYAVDGIEWLKVFLGNIVENVRTLLGKVENAIGLIEQKLNGFSVDLSNVIDVNILNGIC